MAYLLWLEETAFSTWLRESGPAFFTTLTMHSVAMGFLVGAHVATDLRVLGAAAGVPLSLMRGFAPVARAALGLSVLSGVLLVAAYPAKALTNGVFYLKLLAVAGALLAGRSLGRKWLSQSPYDEGRLPGEARALAWLSLGLWAAAITSGRLLAYTYDVLMASHGY